MNMQRCVIVLEGTTHPGNIGATARAMKTMGCEDLRLVNTCAHQHPDSLARSSGADDILFHAKTYQKLTMALADCHYIFGMSARRRTHPTAFIQSDELRSLLPTLAANTRLAFVFGNEQSGLDNQALGLCHYHVCIPTNNSFSSLNVASSVQIITYLLRHMRVSKH